MLFEYSFQFGLHSLSGVAGALERQSNPFKLLDKHSQVESSHHILSLYCIVHFMSRLADNVHSVLYTLKVLSIHEYKYTYSLNLDYFLMVFVWGLGMGELVGVGL